MEYRSKKRVVERIITKICKKYPVNIITFVIINKFYFECQFTQRIVKTFRTALLISLFLTEYKIMVMNVWKGLKLYYITYSFPAQFIWKTKRATSNFGWLSSKRWFWKPMMRPKLRHSFRLHNAFNYNSISWVIYLIT